MLQRSRLRSDGALAVPFAGTATIRVMLERAPRSSDPSSPEILPMTAFPALTGALRR